MTDEEAFLAAIRANPADDTVRLVFADWLDDRSDSRGEFLRTHRFALLRNELGTGFRSDRAVFCPLLGTEVPISVYTGGDEMQPEQAVALAQFLAIPSGERAILHEPLFENYRDWMDAVGEGPEIAGPERVWAFVRWTNVIVPRQGVGSRFVFVQGDADWEPEHGVELLFRAEQLVHLDQASGAFLTTSFWEW